MNIKSSEYNDDLVGFVVELENGKTVQVQFERETNVLHADYGTFSPVIDRDNEYGLDLTDEEEEAFIAWMKKDKSILAKAEELENEE